MRRMVILGNSGSGKSRLARTLGARLDLPVVHLDPLYYGAGWVHGDAATFRRRVTEALTGDAWIVDGAFLSLVGDITLPRAEQVIWLEQPRWRALVRALARCIDPRQTARADLPAGCRDTPSREMLADIWSFERKGRPDLERRLATLAPATPIHRLRGDHAVAAFVQSVAG
jgi:adenylate kinase family enzyme